MKNWVVVLVIVFATTSLIGCSKKKNEESASMEGLNGVVSENVISLDESAGQDAVPVVVDNTDMLESQSAVEMPAEMTTSTEKPSPKQIQLALKNAGFYAGKIDGTIGPKTKKAIEAFQAQNGLKADGKVGPKTWKVLSEYLNRPAEVANPSSEIQAIGQ